MKRFCRLAAMVVACMWAADGASQSWSECPTPTSCLPDTDRTGFNNSLATAIDLGLAADPATSQPRTLTANGQLGEVLTGFDTIDFFKFRLPPELFEVEIATRETPDTSSWIMIYDEQGKPLIRAEEGRGRDHERVTLPLKAGLYYVSVATDAEVAKAKGGRLRYSLTIRPIQRPLPNDGMANCGPQAGWLLVDNSRDFSGSFDRTRLRNTYPIAFARPATVSMSLLRARQFETAIVDRIGNERFALSAKGENTVPPVVLDPGFYCLEVDATQPLPPLLNYKVQLLAGATGFPLGRDRTTAPCLPIFNLGNQARNGHYSKPRHTQEAPCEIEDLREYVVREWVGQQSPEGWIRIHLSQARRLELRLSNLYNPLRAELQDAGGTIVGTSAVSGISLTDQLPHQTWSGTLPSGSYYLRLFYLGTRAPGTSFELRLTARP
jgi:hypothetical protein